MANVGIVALVVLLMLSGALLFAPSVDAAKSLGTRNTATTSDLICGDMLCSELHELSEDLTHSTFTVGGVAQQSSGLISGPTSEINVGDFTAKPLPTSSLEKLIKSKHVGVPLILEIDDIFFSNKAISSDFKILIVNPTLNVSQFEKNDVIIANHNPSHVLHQLQQIIGNVSFTANGNASIDLFSSKFKPLPEALPQFGVSQQSAFMVGGVSQQESISPDETITVIEINGHYFSIDQFIASPPDACEYEHYHAANYHSIVSVDGIVTMYDESECGFGSAFIPTFEIILGDTIEFVTSDEYEITTLDDGTTITAYSDGYTATYYPDGTLVEEYPNGAIYTWYADGTSLFEYPDGHSVSNEPMGWTCVQPVGWEFVEVPCDELEIEGEVESGGDVQIEGQDITIGGEVESEEGLNIEQLDITIEGEVESGGDVQIEGQDITIGGEVESEDGITIGGEVESGEDVHIEGGTVIEGEVESEEGLNIEQLDVTIEGEVESGGDVQIEGQDITIGGEVESDDGITIEGEVESGGDVHIEGGTVIEAEPVVTEFEDGSVRTEHSDGTVVTVKADGETVTIKPDGTVEVVTADGMVVTEYPDGKSVTVKPDGEVITTNPDGTTVFVKPDQTVITHNPDGSIVTVNPDATIVTTYPDGTVVTVNKDGSITTTTPEEPAVKKYFVAFATTESHAWIELYDGENVYKRGLWAAGHKGTVPGAYLVHAGEEIDKDNKPAVPEEAGLFGTIFYGGTGAIKDEKKAIKGTAWVGVEITETEYNQLVDYINTAPTDYSVANRNCVDFTIEIANQLGIELPSPTEGTTAGYFYSDPEAFEANIKNSSSLNDDRNEHIGDWRSGLKWIKEQLQSESTDPTAEESVIISDALIGSTQFSSTQMSTFYENAQGIPNASFELQSSFDITNFIILNNGDIPIYSIEIQNPYGSSLDTLLDGWISKPLSSDTLLLTTENYPILPDQSLGVDLDILYGTDSLLWRIGDQNGDALGLGMTTDSSESFSEYSNLVLEDTLLLDYKFEISPYYLEIEESDEFNCVKPDGFDFVVVPCDELDIDDTGLHIEGDDDTEVNTGIVSYTENDCWKYPIVKDGNETDQDRYHEETNEQGKVTKQKFTDSNGVDHEVVYEYDSQGNLVRKVYTIFSTPAITCDKIFVVDSPPVVEDGSDDIGVSIVDEPCDLQRILEDENVALDGEWRMDDGSLGYRYVDETTGTIYYFDSEPCHLIRTEVIETGSTPDDPPPTMYGEEIDPNLTYCGPDFTEAFLNELKTSWSRAQNIPEDDTGSFDGLFFMAEHGGIMDLQGANRAQDENGVLIDGCAENMCSLGNSQLLKTKEICGACIINHNTNEVLYGLMASAVEVDFAIAVAGAQAHETFTYPGWELEPPSARASYALGYAVDDAFDELGPDEWDVESFCTAITNTDTWDTMTSHPGLDQCALQPDHCVSSKVNSGFNNNNWTLENGYLDTSGNFIESDSPPPVIVDDSDDTVEDDTSDDTVEDDTSDDTVEDDTSDDTVEDDTSDDSTDDQTDDEEVNDPPIDDNTPKVNDDEGNTIGPTIPRDPETPELPETPGDDDGDDPRDVPPDNTSADLSTSVARTTAFLVPPGGTSSFTVTYNNLGPDVAIGNVMTITVADAFGTSPASISNSVLGGTIPMNPNGIGANSCVTGPLAVNCTVASFKKGDTVTVNLDLGIINTAKSGNLLTVTSTISSNTPDPNPANNKDSRNALIQFGGPIEVIKTDNDLNKGDLVPGDIIEYEITITNHNEDPTVDYPELNELEDSIPDGTTYVSNTLVIDGESQDDDIKDGIGFDAVKNSIIWNGIISESSEMVVLFKVMVDQNIDSEIISNQAIFDQNIIQEPSDDPDTTPDDDPTESTVVKEETDEKPKTNDDKTTTPIVVIKPTIAFDKPEYTKDDSIKITITDKDANTEPGSVENISLKVRTDEDVKSKTVLATESSKNSHVFIATIIASEITNNPSEVEVFYNQLGIGNNESVSDKVNIIDSTDTSDDSPNTSDDSPNTSDDSPNTSDDSTDTSDDSTDTSDDTKAESTPKVKSLPKPKDKESVSVDLVGSVSSIKRGVPLIVTVIGPDGSQQEFGVFPDNSGSYSTEYNITSKDNVGEYKIFVKYDDQIVDEFSISLIGEQVPTWVKSNAKLWSTGTIDDDTFVSGIQYLIENDIMILQGIPETTGSSGSIPTWVKSNAGLWADGTIDDSTFVNGIKFLIENGIISIS